MKFITFNFKLILLLIVSTTSNAVTITVTANHGLVDNVDGVCSISEAIINANDGAQTHTDCLAGSGTDTIELTQDIILNVVYENDTTYGSTGTPPISTTTTLDGKGFTLQRDSNLPCIIDDTNTADEFRILRTTTSADLSLLNITIANGCANGGRGDDSDGGGLHNRGNFLSLQQVTFKQNKTRVDGGAINLDRGTIALIRNSLFVGNTSALGGAIAMNNSTYINTIENSTFSHNTSDFGSAISVIAATIDTIQNTTFSNNSFGHAIYNGEGTINNLQNTLFHNNAGYDDPDCRNFLFGITNGSNNITTHPNPSPTFGCTGFIATVLDPLTVGDLSDNGGATMTHAILAGSQALNAGDSNSTTTDQRGFGLNGVRDIGAYETQVIELCPMALMTDGFSTTVNNADDLIQAIECSNNNGNVRDLINMGTDITLTSQYENNATFGRTGTPAMTTALTLHGNGFILKRDSSITAEFRLLRTTTTADVIIDNIELVNGKVSGINSLGRGGAIFNQSELILKNSILRQNNASVGGGLAHSDLSGSNQPIISNTLFKQNSVSSSGSDIYIVGLLELIENSTFTESGNKASLFLSNGVINTMNNVTFSTVGSTSIQMSDGVVGSINNSSFIGSTTAIKSFDGDAGIMGTVTNLNNNIFKSTTACSVVIITNVNNNLADTLTTCDGTTVGNAGVASNISTSLSDNSCSIPLSDGSCLPTHALLAGSNAINASTTNPTTVDGRGFAAQGTRDIGSFEARIPVLTAPADVVAESTGATTAVTLGTATVTDDETGLVATVDNSGPFAMGMTTVTWSVTDSHGFSAVDVTQVVNVQAVIAGNVSGLNGTVSLQNNNTDTININANGNFRFTTALDNLSNYTVTVPQQPATQNCVIANSSGQVNGGNVSDIIITCSDNTLSLSNSTLDFGVVFTGENSTQTVTLTNSGTGDVTIGSFTNPNTPFSIVGGSCIIGQQLLLLMPGESCDFIVAFNPLSEGGFSSSFDVISNAVSSPTTINLTGSSGIRIIPSLSFYGLILMLFGVVFVVTHQRKL